MKTVTSRKISCFMQSSLISLALSEEKSSRASMWPRCFTYIHHQPFLRHVDFDSGDPLLCLSIFLSIYLQSSYPSSFPCVIILGLQSVHAESFCFFSPRAPFSLFYILLLSRHLCSAWFFFLGLSLFVFLRFLRFSLPVLCSFLIGALLYTSGFLGTSRSLGDAQSGDLSM